LNFQLVNDYLTSIFNNVLVIEETSLRSSRFNDVSIKEMHTIDVIGSTPNATPSDISRSLMVTLGTVTTSLNNLERKGYIERTRSEIDRRVVHLSLTQWMVVAVGALMIVVLVEIVKAVQRALGKDKNAI